MPPLSKPHPSSWHPHRSVKPWGAAPPPRSCAAFRTRSTSAAVPWSSSPGARRVPHSLGAYSTPRIVLAAGATCSLYSMIAAHHVLHCAQSSVEHNLQAATTTGSPCWCARPAATPEKCCYIFTAICFCARRSLPHHSLDSRNTSIDSCSTSNRRHSHDCCCAIQLMLPSLLSEGNSVIAVHPTNSNAYVKRAQARCAAKQFWLTVPHLWYAILTLPAQRAAHAGAVLFLIRCLPHLPHIGFGRYFRHTGNRCAALFSSSIPMPPVK